MQDKLTFSKETILEEIKLYQESIDEWEQELLQVQAELKYNIERDALLNELKNQVTPGSKTDIVQANIDLLRDEFIKLNTKEIKLNGSIKTYQEFVKELNKML